MKTEDIKNYHVTETLRDRRMVSIRAVRPDDKGLVIDGLRDVSAESLYGRFLTTKREITVHGLKQVTEVDFVNVVALLVVLEKDGKEQIVGGGRYIRTEAAGAVQRAEVAFLIQDAFQGLGIASQLLKHLVAIARDSGIRQFEAEVLPRNEPMLRVFARSGLPVTKTATRDSVHLLVELTGEKKSSGAGHSGCQK